MLIIDTEIQNIVIHLPDDTTVVPEKLVSEIKFIHKLMSKVDSTLLHQHVTYYKNWADDWHVLEMIEPHRQLLSEFIRTGDEQVIASVSRVTWIHNEQRYVAILTDLRNSYGPEYAASWYVMNLGLLT